MKPNSLNFVIRSRRLCWRSLTTLLLLLIGLSLVWPGPLSTQAQEATAGQPYVVQRGDTLSKIAEKYLGAIEHYPTIVAATRAKQAEDPSFADIQNPDLIEVGAKLWIPAEPSSTPVAPVPAAAPPTGPTGQIAFSFWNNASNRCTYEINIIDVQACLAGAESCQANRRIFSLNNASEPALSPDGQRLAFRGWGDIPEKYNDDQLDHPYFDCAEPRAQRRLGHTSLDATDYLGLTDYYEDSHPDWSPDGQRLLFDTDRNPDQIIRLRTVSREGSYEEELRLAGQQPSWAPDNDRFVYRGCDLTGNRCGLWLARALPVRAWETGSNLIGPLLQEPEAAHPDWSPVSDRIVYQSPAGGSWDLYLVNADGSGQRQLTSAESIEGLPAWSPDGQWIAYLSDAEEGWGIWIVKADGSQPQRLFAFDGGIFTPLPIVPYGQRSWLDEQVSWSVK